MKRCNYWLLQFVQWFCILLGFTTIVIDFKRNRVQIYPIVKIYVTLINIYNICLILKTLYNDIWQSDIVDFTFVTLFSSLFIVVSRILLGLLMILKRPYRDNALEKWLKEVFHLQEKYFVHYMDVTKDTVMRKLWLLSTLILILHFFNVGVYIYKGKLLANINALTELHAFSSLIGMQQIIMLHHTSTLCYIYESFSLINKQFPKVSAFLIYSQLTGLLNQINIIYSPLIFCLQLNFLLTISTILFSFIVLFKLNAIYSQTFAFSLYGNFYLFLIIHMLIYFFMCHKVSEIESETNFSILHIMGVNDNRELEQFCLIRKMQQIAVNVYGVLKIDLSFLFEIIANIFKYIIILLQIYMQAGLQDQYD
ncbi:uncharacterized protein ACRADG_010256 [Cochliomyia hominivorax]